MIDRNNQPTGTTLPQLREARFKRKELCTRHINRKSMFQMFQIVHINTTLIIVIGSSGDTHLSTAVAFGQWLRGSM